MKVNVVSIVFKVAFTYLFIVVLGKGINYMAVSTFIGALVISCFALYEIFILKTFKELSFKNFKFDYALLKRIVIISFPVIIERTSISYSFVMVNSRVLLYGELVLAAYGITNRINSLLFRVLGGVASGLATVVSQNYGAKKENRIKKSIYYASLFGIVSSIIFAIVLLGFKHQFATLLTGGDLLLYGHVINAMNVYTISIIPWAIFQVVLGIFMGTGFTKYNLYISLIRMYLLRLPIIYILTNIASFNEYSVWYGMLISNILTAVFALVFYFLRRKHIFESIET